MARTPIRIPDLVAKWEPEVRKAFEESIRTIRNPARMARLVELAEANDVDGILAELKINPASFRPLDRAISDAYEAGGENAAAGAKVPGQSRFVVQFDMRNPTAEGWLRSYSSTLIREITDDQRVLIRDVLAAGTAAGRNPKATALDLVGRINPATGRREGGAIGLTASQEGWCRRYAEELASGNPAALTRKLRDRRFDGAVTKAIKSGQPIPAETITKLVAAYRNRALRHRAITIARTETLRAMNAAAFESARQMIERGEVSEALVSKVWHSAKDERVRHTHSVLDGQRVPFRSMFRSPSGAFLAYPCDPAAPAEETVCCRCWMSTAVDFFAGLT
ncbi:phage minor head protein [Methylobacterium nodulans]|uniref:Putative head morphogenesis protein SPP1 gp7 n=1 Tax=Methylobacterium nodulans (strain LMG 21967 / CNCM I-2342 / ORS 2060) TaxID=460265 RepID=B8INT8_METNO|nr:phage minor head protein [Methylobacterium nodulans]ACL58454.1 putative head morphogenesis protein SPP1 gp7 [Methylobacterium nodulans ORS 2060]